MSAPTGQPSSAPVTVFAVDDDHVLIESDRHTSYLMARLLTLFKVYKMSVLEDRIKKQVAKAMAYIDGDKPNRTLTRTYKLIDECNDTFEEANQIIDYLAIHSPNLPFKFTRYNIWSAPGYTRTPKALPSVETLLVGL
ncbi:hypothetical protein BKA70DRAFT_1225245 [Coprinopsis sp. MPI-PUGE-AT-0042]|nr:hypothetical protein BKA70DRAFT_1225245 [Coprinopsis sp. MPI-PUGE-AT-0042]